MQACYECSVRRLTSQGLGCDSGQPAGVLNAPVLLLCCAVLLQGWGENDRGVSYTFGPDCVTDFLQRHDLDLVCRAHQVRTAS